MKKKHYEYGRIVVNPPRIKRNAKYYKRSGAVIRPLDGPLYDKEVEGIGGPMHQLTYYKIPQLTTRKAEYRWLKNFKEYRNQLSKINHSAVRYISGVVTSVPYKVKLRARNILRHGLKEVSLAYSANKALAKNTITAYAVIETIARYEGPIRKELRGIRQQPSFSIMKRD